LNCTCCKDNENARVKQETIDTINEQLQENHIPRKVDRYWVCPKRKGAFPKVLEQTLSDRNKYLILLKEEQDKANPDPKLVEEYQTLQLGANAGFGLFDNEYFEFSNYKVAECITAEARRIHKQMETLAQNLSTSRSCLALRIQHFSVEEQIQKCKILSRAVKIILVLSLN